MRVRDVEYYVHTVGDGPIPVLLLHGFTGKHSNWFPAIEMFQKKHQFTFVFIDFLGHGNSDSPKEYNRYSMEETVQDLKVIIKKLGYTKLLVAGYSMGGRVALSFAHEFPEMVEKLILESSSPGLQLEVERAERSKQDDILAAKIEQEGVETFIDFWVNIPLFASQQKILSEAKLNDIRNQKLQNNVVGLSNSLRGLGTGSQPSLWDQLEHLTIPVLILVGEWDEKFVRIGEKMHEKLRNSTFLKIIGAGHAIHVEQPEKFGKIVSEFCRN